MADQPNNYTVRRGDTVSEIAQAYVQANPDKGLSLREVSRDIIATNNLRTHEAAGKDIAIIHIGQELVLPPGNPPEPFMNAHDRGMMPPECPGCATIPRPPMPSMPLLSRTALSGDVEDAAAKLMAAGVSEAGSASIPNLAAGRTPGGIS